MSVRQSAKNRELLVVGACVCVRLREGARARDRVCERETECEE